MTMFELSMELDRLRSEMYQINSDRRFEQIERNQKQQERRF
jgi:hypothetical protein